MVNNSSLRYIDIGSIKVEMKVVISLNWVDLPGERRPRRQLPRQFGRWIIQDEQFNWISID